MVDNKKIKRIKEIVSKWHNYFILKTLGPDFLSDNDYKELQRLGFDVSSDEDYVKDTYVAGHTRGNAEPTYTKLTHNEFKFEPKPYLTTSEVYAINHLKDKVKQNVENLSTKIQTNTESVIRNNNLEHRNFIISERELPAFVEGIESNKRIKKIAEELREKTEDYNRDWERVARTEMSNAMSIGSADAIIKRNADKKSDEIFVAKLVVNDAALCEKCREFYLNPNGTPKCYTIAELVANGSNEGKKNKDLKPVISATHPNERCSLVEIPDGWGFKGQQMIYISPSYKYYYDKK